MAFAEETADDAEEDEMKGGGGAKADAGVDEPEVGEAAWVEYIPTPTGTLTLTPMAMVALMLSPRGTLYDWACCCWSW